jgi:ribonuclease VapC
MQTRVSVAKAVLDASALLAYIKIEPGAERVAQIIGDSMISTVNYAEVVSKFVSLGATLSALNGALRLVELDLIDFDRGLAEAAGELISRTRSMGLSLGDRACLALAARERLPVLTTDRAWANLNIGLDIQLIR